MNFMLFCLALFLFYAAVIILLKPQKSDLVYLLILGAAHFACAWAFFESTKGMVTDSVNYFDWASEPVAMGFLGSGFIIELVRVAKFFVGENYLPVFLWFSTLSAFGISLSYVTLSKTAAAKRGSVNKLILRLTLLLPGLHFWTSPIGKDALTVFSYGLIVYSLFGGVRTKFLLLCFGIFFIFLVRPHVGGIAIIVLGLRVTQHVIHDLRGGKRLVVLSISLGIWLLLAAVVYLVLFSFVQKYSALGFDSFSDFLLERQDVYAGTASGFDSSSYPYLIRFFLFLLGGIPWSIGGLLQVFAMVEGLVVLAIFTGTLKAFLTARRHAQSLQASYGVAFFYYAVLLTGVLAFSAGNFGLIARQRVMVYIPLFVAFVLLRTVVKHNRGTVDHLGKLLGKN